MHDGGKQLLSCFNGSYRKPEGGWIIMKYYLSKAVVPNGSKIGK